MYALLYERRSEASLRLWARAVAAAVSAAGGRALLACVTASDYAAAGAGPEETDGIVDSLRGVDGVEVAALVKEQTGGVRTRVSLRSETIDVSAVAALRDGGGHKLAAGFSSDDSPEEVIAWLSSELGGTSRHVLLIDEPEGFPWHDVVDRVRRNLRPNVKKVGHAGTLDPFATGSWSCWPARATKLARFFVDLPKEYECTVRFGVRSDTGDLTGDLTETGKTTTRAAVDEAIPQFLGRIMQSVPMTSAVKVDGERLYKKAHRGEVVETPVKEFEIRAFHVLELEEAAQR